MELAAAPLSASTVTLPMLEPGSGLVPRQLHDMSLGPIACPELLGSMATGSSLNLPVLPARVSLTPVDSANTKPRSSISLQHGKEGQVQTRAPCIDYHAADVSPILASSSTENWLPRNQGLHTSV